MTAILRLLGPAGIVGAVLSLALGVLLFIQKGETRHWRKQSDQFETLYRNEQAALAQTVANYRAAADQARASDKANAERVVAEQKAINERTSHDYEARIAAARAAAQRLRSGTTATNSGRGGTAPVPGISTAAGGPAEGSSEAGLSDDDALTATEQAIQLDELIKWVRKQSRVDANGPQKGRQ